MNTPHHLAQLLALSAQEFAQYLESVQQLAQLRRTLECAAPSAVERAPLEPPASASLQPYPGSARAAAPVPKRLTSRPPMRAPKPGTLRGDIHDILRAARKPIQRTSVIKAVADRRGRPVDKRLAAKVSDLLANPHDPFVTRVSRGFYTVKINRD
jgi:hypothetical protein